MIVKSRQTLVFSTSVSMLWFALNIFCASCCGLRRVWDFGVATEFKWHWENTGHTHLLAELFPTLEEVMRGHFSWLEELVDGDRQLESQVLQSPTISKEHIWLVLTSILSKQKWVSLSSEDCFTPFRTLSDWCCSCIFFFFKSPAAGCNSWV